VNRITRKLSCGSFEFVDGNGFAKLSHSEGINLLFERLYAYEETGYSPENIREAQKFFRRRGEALGAANMQIDQLLQENTELKRAVAGWARQYDDLETSIPQAVALSDVIAERARQDAKWGQQNHEPVYWLGILGEEYGELCEAINETVFDNGPEARAKGGYENMRAEAVQLAAVAVAFVEMLDRRYGGGSNV
jgi:NTP pyrophosphatase (non-canonical NTP hydrolase)